MCGEDQCYQLAAGSGHNCTLGDKTDRFGIDQLRDWRAADQTIVSISSQHWVGPSAHDSICRYRPVVRALIAFLMFILCSTYHDR